MEPEVLPGKKTADHSLTKQHWNGVQLDHKAGKSSSIICNYITMKDAVTEKTSHNHFGVVNSIKDVMLMKQLVYQVLEFQVALRKLQ